MPTYLVAMFPPFYKFLWSRLSVHTTLLGLIDGNYVSCALLSTKSSPSAMSCSSPHPSSSHTIFNQHFFMSRALRTQHGSHCKRVLSRIRGELEVFNTILLDLVAGVIAGIWIMAYVTCHAHIFSEKIGCDGPCRGRG